MCLSTTRRIEEVFNIFTKEGEKAFKEKDFENATEVSKNGDIEIF
jgi:hypothetical protein